MLSLKIFINFISSGLYLNAEIFYAFPLFPQRQTRVYYVVVPKEV